MTRIATVSAAIALTLLTACGGGGGTTELSAAPGDVFATLRVVRGPMVPESSRFQRTPSGQERSVWIEVFQGEGERLSPGVQTGYNVPQAFKREYDTEAFQPMSVPVTTDDGPPYVWVPANGPIRRNDPDRQLTGVVEYNRSPFDGQKAAVGASCDAEACVLWEADALARVDLGRDVVDIWIHDFNDGGANDDRTPTSDIHIREVTIFGDGALESGEFKGTIGEDWVVGEFATCRRGNVCDLGALAAENPLGSDAFITR